MAPSPAARSAPSGQPQILPYEIDKPVIAAINGAAVGVGITYPMMCDVRIVAEDAKLQFAFVRRGVIPELASHVIVARVAGLSNAADLLLSGRMILGREAAAMGLASEALPRDQVLPRALERAKDIAANTAPVSVAIAKRLLWEGLTSSVPQMREREGKLFTWAGNQPDSKEGVLSFLEKRPPRGSCRRHGHAAGSARRPWGWPLERGAERPGARREKSVNRRREHGSAASGTARGAGTSRSP